MLQKRSDVILEIQKLLPLCRSLYNGRCNRVNMSSLITSTAHSQLLYCDVDRHLKDCLVARRVLPLTLISANKEFLERPCQACLHYRIHHLATKFFCAEFENSSKSDAPSCVSTWLQQELESSFGSLENVTEELIKFSTSSLSPGITWMVFNSQLQRVMFMNLSGTQVPLSFGLWPLMAVEMSEEILCRWQDSDQKDSITESSGASWSRVGRSGHKTLANKEMYLTVAESKRAVASEAVRNLNWPFVEKQLRIAKEYYDSESRRKAQEGWRATQEHTTRKQMLRTIRSLDKEDKRETQQFHQSQTSSKETVNMVRLKEAAASPEDPKAVFHNDTGVWEYTYASGKQSFTYPDGTHIFKEEGITTTVQPDGTKIYLQNGIKTTVRSDDTILYEYPDKSTVLRRPDGVEITTLPDGTAEERHFTHSS